jgi:hypothetical protein
MKEWKITILMKYKQRILLFVTNYLYIHSLDTYAYIKSVIKYLT